MGQRHQVYVALPLDHPLVKKGVKVVGLHHQWLYGHTAAKQLARLLTLIKKAGSGLSHPFVSGFDDPLKILSAIYESIPEEGYYSRVYPFVGDETACCKDPLLADNNEGITVVDLRGLHFTKNCKLVGKVAYAFVSFGHNGLPENTPLSARQYVNAYYESLVPVVRERTIRQAFKGDKKTTNEAEKRVREVEALKVSVLTQEALTEIFPTLQAPARSSLLLLDLGDDDVAV